MMLLTKLQVCRRTFLLSPIYAKDAPARLALREFIIVIIFKVFHVLQIFLHNVFSFFCLFLVNFVWCIWQLAFVRSLSEEQKLFSSHISTKTMLPIVFMAIYFLISLNLFFMGSHFLEISLFICRT